MFVKFEDFMIIFTLEHSVIYQVHPLIKSYKISLSDTYI